MWPRVENIVDIIKITIMLIKTTFKELIKVKKIRKNVLKCIKTYFFLYFPI